MRELVISTNNKHKLEEIKAILNDLPVKVLSLKDFSDVPDVIEDGKTLKANAAKKARIIAKHLNKWALADDTGLEVEHLKGDPGVFSARWAGPGCSYDDNNKKLLSLLKGVGQTKRKAQFRCVIAVSSPKGKVKTVEGKIEGVIATCPSGKQGFGYDPLFIPDGYNKTFAELDSQTKNKISHRAIALQKAKELIRELLLEKNLV